MKLDILLIQIIIIAFPGILILFVYQYISGKKEKNNKIQREGLIKAVNYSYIICVK